LRIRWPKKFDDLDVAELLLRRLDAENSCLKHLVADLSSDKEMLKEVGKMEL
jgi:putative transposase